MPKSSPVVHEITDAEVGQALSTARHSTGLSVRGVAELSGIDWRVLSRIERGERPCRVTEMMTLSKTYGVKYDVMVLAISGQKKALASLSAKRKPKRT